MPESTEPGHVRLARDRGPRPEPAETKRCADCRQQLPLAQFHRRVKGGQGVAGACKTCMVKRYETGIFRCSRCLRDLPGPSFQAGTAGSAISQPCKECRSVAAKAATRHRRLGQGRAPYHLLSAIDEQARTASCRECGPVHIYSTGQHLKGCGWRCGIRAGQMSEAWYNDRAEALGNHASRNWHQLRNVRGDEMRGTCSQCGDVPVRWRESAGYFVCASPAKKARHAEIERRRKRLAIYGLTTADYERMERAQGGRCALCGGTSARSDGDGRLVVDHDHATGAVRALLCNLCNTGLGAMRDDPAILLAAIEYLRLHAERAAA